MVKSENVVLKNVKQDIFLKRKILIRTAGVEKSVLQLWKGKVVIR